ncbi:unnamed protein product [Lymnaea stagnalis]|uniref:Uncharacterized protein n=1 Tax=Lymnaea stagnalis TaxID=6523 RepID=A0AAV2ID53_LYMST
MSQPLIQFHQCQSLLFCFKTMSQPLILFHNNVKPSDSVSSNVTASYSVSSNVTASYSVSKQCHLLLCVPYANNISETIFSLAFWVLFEKQLWCHPTTCIVQPLTYYMYCAAFILLHVLCSPWVRYFILLQVLSMLYPTTCIVQPSS